MCCWKDYCLLLDISKESPRKQNTKESPLLFMTARPSADLPSPGRLAGNAHTMPSTPSCKLRGRMLRCMMDNATRLKLPDINNLIKPRRTRPSRGEIYRIRTPDGRLQPPLRYIWKFRARNFSEISHTQQQLNNRLSTKKKNISPNEQCINKLSVVLHTHMSYNLMLCDSHSPYSGHSYNPPQLNSYGLTPARQLLQNTVRQFTYIINTFL
jgi:hypothetical protein